jgi:hypothetical protein
MELAGILVEDRCFLKSSCVLFLFCDSSSLFDDVNSAGVCRTDHSLFCCRGIIRLFSPFSFVVALWVPFSCDVVSAVVFAVSVDFLLCILQLIPFALSLAVVESR